MSIYVPQKTKPSLPPLLSLLKDKHYTLPAIDTFHSPLPLPSSTPMASKISNIATPSLATPRLSPVEKEPKREFKKELKKQEKSFAFISHSVKTFPSQEPSIDNAPLARRKRRRTSPNELNILNQEFLMGSTPNKLRRIEIANKVCMTEKAVQIWFQNKRQSIRKQSTSEKEITELPPTPDVTINSMNNSMVNISSANTSVLSSTPIKPVLTKSFTSPDPIKYASSESPVKERPLSAVYGTPMTSSIMKPVASTPNSSFDTSANDTFFLQETKKKQPIMLNNSNSSTMTFKLNKFKIQDDKENLKANKIQHLLNTAAEERAPLGELSVNKTSHHKVTEGVQSLLSLRGGNWK